MFELSNYKNIDATVSSIVTQYYILRDSGNYAAANSLIASNKELLQHYYINAESLNKIELGIYNVAKTQLTNQVVIVNSVEPSPSENGFRVGSLWLKKY